MQLHYHPGNASFAPHVLLHEIGAPFELKLVQRMQGEHKQPEYLKLNPNGQIPVVVDGELVLYEAAAICMHLADTHPARHWRRRWARASAPTSTSGWPG